jgi:hypothetical protein
MENDNPRSLKLLTAAFSLYFLGFCVAGTYFNWQFARENGFVTWFFFGEIKPSLKAAVWPYYLFHHGAIDTSVPKPLTETQLARMELKKMIGALNYSQQATALVNSGHSEGGIRQYTNIEKIVEYRRLAYEMGKKANVDILGRIFPGMGTRFRDQFLGAVKLFLAAYDTDSPSLLKQADALDDEWADWYQSNKNAIQAATDKALGF